MQMAGVGNTEVLILPYPRVIVRTTVVKDVVRWPVDHMEDKILYGYLTTQVEMEYLVNIIETYSDLFSWMNPC